MSDYKQTADRIVKQEIGYAYRPDQYTAVLNSEVITAEEFCHDARVVLALMSRMRNVHLDFAYKNGWLSRAITLWGKIAEVVNENRKIAIVLACLEALESDEDRP